MNLKEKLKEKVECLKSFQINSSRFDDVRAELISYNFENLHETIWNILNDFPEHNCKYCKKQTLFKSYQFGYKDFCNVSCSNKFKGQDVEINKKIAKGVSIFNKSLTVEFFKNRANKQRESLNNRTEEEKKIAKENKSAAVKRVHKQRSIEDKIELNNKISKSVKESKLAKEQRIKRAKLGANALKEYIKSLTLEELKEFNKKYSKDVISESDKADFKQYYKLVWYFTNLNAKLVENIEKRSIYFHLDHKFSIKEGFLEKISPEIIGSSINLEIIPYLENCSKGSKCSISKEELVSSFEKLKIGDF